MTEYKKEDYRIVKTKKALVRAFGDLMTENCFENITVNELCDRANVRRATFYKHFRDKNDFMVYVIKMFREEFDSKIWRKGTPDATKEYYVKYALALVEYLSSTPNLASNILSSSACHMIITMLMEQNYNDTKERLLRSVEQGMELRMSADTAASMLTGGISMVLILWFEGGRTGSKDKLTEDITAILDCIFG